MFTISYVFNTYIYKMLNQKIVEKTIKQYIYLSVFVFYYLDQGGYVFVGMWGAPAELNHGLCTDMRYAMCILTSRPPVKLEREVSYFKTLNKLHSL